MNVQTELTNREIWKPVKSNGRYEISSFGRVRTTGSKRILKPFANNRKNLQVNLYKGPRVRVTHFVHRLVAEHFMEGFVDHLRIVHIDGDKNNCRIENIKHEQHTKSARWAWDEEGKKRRG